MAMFKRRTIVFVGATLIEYAVAKFIAPYLEIPAQTPIFSLIVVANIATAFLADWVYKKYRG